MADTKVDNLIINVLSKAQYDSATKSNTELYLVPDEIDATPTQGSDNPVKSGGVYSALQDKQDTISDLATIRSGASAGATAYQKPGTGIPSTDLASAVQTSLGKADTALQSYTETDPTVPSWAKASSKPSYTFSEIGSKPATLSGYGITDAKIQNGVITLGSNTITPLTSFTETDPTVPSWAKQSTKPTYTYSEIQNTPTIPTVPTISTDIVADATSDTKTASPKAVKTYVDNMSPSGESMTNAEIDAIWDA